MGRPSRFLAHPASKATRVNPSRHAATMASSCRSRIALKTKNSVIYQSFAMVMGGSRPTIKVGLNNSGQPVDVYVTVPLVPTFSLPYCGVQSPTTFGSSQHVIARRDLAHI